MKVSENDPYVRIMRLSDDALEEKLRQGEMVSELQAFLGPAEYQELRALAQEASARSVRGGERVLLLPGIMGSRLAVKKKKSSDLIWLEPFSLFKGNLTKLAFGGENSAQIITAGAISIYYLKMKLLLRLSGYNVDYHAYDWRLSVWDTGKQLAERILKQESGNVSLVAHSMGGLVARAMLASDPAANKRVNRLIMLGTPHEGSFDAVTTLRATGSTIQKLAKWIDQKHDAAELVNKVINTFPGLHELLPSKRVTGGMDVYEDGFWTGDFPKPHPDHLKAAASFRAKLAPADERFFQISGIDLETTTSIETGESDFQYVKSVSGDGTVPITSAKLEGAKQYYVKAEHGGMANNRTIYKAVKDILNFGDTDRLMREWTPQRFVGDTRKVSDLELRNQVETDPNDLDLHALSQLNDTWLGFSRNTELGEPTSVSFAKSSSGALDLRQLSIVRRKTQRLEIRLALGSIAEVDSRAYALGIFSGVAPMGAARALDLALNGVIEDLTKRRMFHGNVGEVFMLPANRRRLLADFVLFVGLGSFDSFDHAAQELAGENIVRNLVQTHIEEFATVLVGAGSGKNIHYSLKSLLTGFVRGLKDVDTDCRFRRITLCENDPKRFALLREALFQLAGSELFGGMELFLDEVELPKPRTYAPAVMRKAEQEPIYLIVRREERSQIIEPVDHETEMLLSEPAAYDFNASLLGAGNKATVMTDYKTVEVEALAKLLSPLDNHESLKYQELESFGEDMAKLLLPESIATALASYKDRPLVMVNDAPASRLPWEALKIDGTYPALNGGMVRRLLAGQLSVAKWLESRQASPTLRILLVVNPTLDLPGAQREGELLQETFEHQNQVEVDVLEGRNATKPALLRAFASGKYDVLHYAGHAIFFPDNPNQSAILCANNVPLRGEELTSLGSLPMLMVFNACEAGRVRGMRNSVEAHIRHKVGFAEAFLRGGVSNYVGTYWPVGDAAAATFAEHFYNDLLQGKSIGTALNLARKALHDARLNEWANYIHYGGFDYYLKERT